MKKNLSKTETAIAAVSFIVAFLAVLSVGALCCEYALEGIFQLAGNPRDIPFYLCALLSLFTAPVWIPAAIVVAILLP